MELECALHHLRHRNFVKAVDTLKAFEKKEQHVKAMAATNLSFIYFLEGDVSLAQQYADLAYELDRYSAKALVNKGNCLTIKNDHAVAKQFYLEAIGVEADCAEAIYNLGLVNFKLQAWSAALQAFEKLHQVVPNSAEVIYQVAAIHEVRGSFDVALRWYTILSTHVPYDAPILLRLGQLCSRGADELQALHFHLESYRHYPASLDVLSWLGVWYVKSEMYERAAHFFERASQIQPHEVKWQLMVTSCFRRVGDINRALHLYKHIHYKYPDNAECVRYLIAIAKDIGSPYEHYQSKLASFERARENFSEKGGISDNSLQAQVSDLCVVPTGVRTKTSQDPGGFDQPAIRSEDFHDADVSRLLPV